MYEKLAELIEVHANDLSRAIAQIALDSRLPAYSGLSLDILAQQIKPTLAMVVRYTRSGEPDEFRDYTIKVTENRLREGRNIADVLTLTYIMAECAKAVIARELPGEENRAMRERFIRRLDSIHTFGTITVNTTRSQHRKPTIETT